MKKLIGILNTVWNWIKMNFSIKGTKSLKIAGLSFFVASLTAAVLISGIERIYDPVYTYKEFKSDSQISQLLSVIQKYKFENRQLKKDLIEKNDTVITAYEKIKDQDSQIKAMRSEQVREAQLVSNLRMQVVAISKSLRIVQDSSKSIQCDLNVKTQELIKSQNVVNSGKAFGWILGFMMAGLK